MSTGDHERREMADRLDAPFWVKAWNWLLDSKWGIWLVIPLCLLLVIWWKY